MTIEEAKLYIKEAQKKGSVLGMESIRRLCERLGNPQNYGKIIHIAGTNGKGSTGRMVEQALMAMGYKVGRYSSPAVFAYEEIIQVNQQNITWEELAKLFSRIRKAADDKTTSFEMETAAAFLYFQEQKCDFSVIEVGLGGSEDATNVIEKPVVSVITSISRDHTAFLGNTLTEIAEKKAGIIKQSGDVVKLFQTPEINEVFIRQVIRQQNSEKNLHWAKTEEFQVLDMTERGITIRTPENETFNVGMTGRYQQENFACAWTTLKVLEKQGLIPLCEKMESVCQAFSNICWPGRMEVIADNPLVIVDGCHNPDAAAKVRRTMEELFAKRCVHFVIGVFKDKEYEDIFAQVLPLGVSADCVKPEGPRGLAKEELLEVAKRHLEVAESHETVAKAVACAMKRCNTKEDMVLCFGSLSYLGEVKQYVNGICKSIDAE